MSDVVKRVRDGTTFGLDGAQLEFTDDDRLVTPFGEFRKKD
jgi:hypothetical protein